MSQTLKKYYPLIFISLLIAVCILAFVTTFVRLSDGIGNSQFGDSIPAVFAYQQEEPVVVS